MREPGVDGAESIGPQMPIRLGATASANTDRLPPTFPALSPLHPNGGDPKQCDQFHRMLAPVPMREPRQNPFIDLFEGEKPSPLNPSALPTGKWFSAER
jgi:hypothetical protein